MPGKPYVLLVDDDPGLLDLLAMRLSAEGYETTGVASAGEALDCIATRYPDAVITDLRMDGMDGMALFQRVQERWPALPVIILTAHGSIREAVQATQQGVFSFLTKPVARDELLTTVARAVEVNAATPEAGAAWRGSIVTRSARMHHLLEQARLVAQRDVNVLISGESGTGKELLARAIHEASHRRGGAFVAVNCSAIPENLLESELFGHVKGAFTGASRDHPGLFVSASGGSLFLDEIGDMPLMLQSKLLRVLQERCVRPVGGTRDRDIDVRILSATHCDLDLAVREGRFREDLFYRLNVVNLHLPALQERKEDVALLANHFLQDIARQQGEEPRQLAPEAMAELIGYRWPGNIRQLQNVMERLVALSVSPVIARSQVLNALPDERVDAAVSLSEAKKAFERDYVLRLLQATAGNVSEAARQAGRNRSDFYKIIQRHGIAVEHFK